MSPTTRLLVATSASSRCKSAVVAVGRGDSSCIRSRSRSMRWQCASFSSHTITNTLPPNLRHLKQQQRFLAVSTTSSTTTTLTDDKQQEDAVVDATSKKRRRPSLASSYAALAKARLSALVVTTTAAGFLAAGPLPVTMAPETFAACCLGTLLCSSSAAAWNQIVEIPRDQSMKRTQQRPLVQQHLSVTQAQVAATVWGVSGTGLLWLGTDPLTTTLGVGNMVLYSGLYTYMKPHSTWNTWVGAVVGAIPPVMGYTAATASTAHTAALLDSTMIVLQDPIAWTLGATLYLWQLPHFLALSFMYKTDYQRGGFAMLPCPDPLSTSNSAADADAAAEETAKVIVRYAWYLAAVPVASTLCQVTHSMYLLEGLVFNGYALHVAHKFQRERTNQNARKIFLTSLWYLPCSLMLFLLHSKTWDDTNKNEQPNAWAQHLTQQMQAIRQYGREMCWHERQYQQNPSQENNDKSSESSKNNCPIVVGKETTKDTVDQAARTVTTVVQLTAPTTTATTPEALSMMQEVETTTTTTSPLDKDDGNDGDKTV